MGVITDTSKPKHELVIALVAKGYSGFELLYYPMRSPTCGWTLEGLLYVSCWLGYTTKGALKRIAELPDKADATFESTRHLR